MVLRRSLGRAVSKALTDAFEDGDISDLRSGKTLILKRRRNDEYQTSTGKIELYSTRAEKLGLTPLPKRYPLATNDGFVFLNSATKNILIHNSKMYMV